MEDGRGKLKEKEVKKRERIKKTIPSKNKVRLGFRRSTTGVQE
jgi:hypothetical protein